MLRASIARQLVFPPCPPRLEVGSFFASFLRSNAFAPWTPTSWSSPGVSIGSTGRMVSFFSRPPGSRTASIVRSSFRPRLQTAPRCIHRLPSSTWPPTCRLPPSSAQGVFSPIVGLPRFASHLSTAGGRSGFLSLLFRFRTRTSPVSIGFDWGGNPRRKEGIAWHAPVDVQVAPWRWRWRT